MKKVTFTPVKTVNELNEKLKSDIKVTAIIKRGEDVEIIFDTEDDEKITNILPNVVKLLALERFSEMNRLKTSEVK